MTRVSVALTWFAFISSTSLSEEVAYNRDIRPILSDKCFACHGPDATTRESDLRLDLRDDAIAYGAIVPGDSQGCLLIERVVESDPDLVMPPSQSHKSLTEVERQVLIRWIDSGARYEAHWAYESIRLPAVPAASSDNPVLSPIDRFVQHRLSKEAISPSPEADRATLLRRLSLDLTGLPPTAAELSTYLKDTSPDAYERQVERLLATPQYGERMAQEWLDVARYADTVGYHGDQNQHAWPYRDYVVKAFNENKPFDTFTQEQLAGDLLCNPTEEQRTATCFNRLNMVTREGGAQPKEYLSIYTADRVRTVSTAFLGSTFVCAECHDHKFDPITQKDFYSLGAFFADVKQYGVYNDYDYAPVPELKGFTNDHPFPPEIQVVSAALVRRRDEILAEIDTAAASVDDRSPHFREWRKRVSEFLRTNPSGWEWPAPTVVGRESPSSGDVLAEGGEEASAAPRQSFTPLPTWRVEDDHRVLFRGGAPLELELSLDPETRSIALIRLDLLPHPKHDDQLLTSTYPSRVVLRFETDAGGKRTPVGVRYASATQAEARYVSGDLVLGVTDGWQLDSSALNRPQAAAYVLDDPVELAAGERLVATLNVESPKPSWAAPKPEELSRLGGLRLGVSSLPLCDLRDQDHPSKVGERFGDDEFARHCFVRGSAVDRATYRHIADLEQALLLTGHGVTPVMVTERTPEPVTVRMLPRGDWQDESGQVCKPGTPHFLPSARLSPDRPLTRLDLADWICSDQNPLTARVVMNRLWMQFFGRGLSSQVDDVGSQGEPPSHPELLDWLACEFRDGGWNTKRMVRLIVTSHTYRQSSRGRQELLDLDPHNRLLAYQNPRRLEAENVRDNILAIAGAINLEVGGPPVHPYQPSGYHDGLQFPDRAYNEEVGPQQYRRGLYTHWQRTFLHPMLANFDAPSREGCTAMRIESNSPQQALTLLNDPSMIEAARLWATRLIEGAASDPDRLERAFAEALARSPKEEEQVSLLAFLTEARRNFAGNPDDARRLLSIGGSHHNSEVDPGELAAWTNVARVILNLHETITRY